MPHNRAAARSRRLRDFLEDLLFRQPDFDALCRGWEVHRPTAFRRVYRDPRWYGIASCADCHGTGLTGVHLCPVCAGRPTVRSTEVATVVP